jgi:hypothetical protein
VTLRTSVRAVALLLAAACARQQPAPDTAADEERLLAKAREAALASDWIGTLALSQQGKGRAARVQAEVASRAAARPGPSWSGRAVAAGFGRPGQASGSVSEEVYAAWFAASDAGPSTALVLRELGAGSERTVRFERPLSSATFARGGEALLVRLEGGPLAVLALPGLERLAELDLPPLALAAAGQRHLLVADAGLLVAPIAGGPRERLCGDGGDPFVALDADGTLGFALHASGRLETWHLAQARLVSSVEGVSAPADLSQRLFFSGGALRTWEGGAAAEVVHPARAPAQVSAAQGLFALAPPPDSPGPLEVWSLAGRTCLQTLPAPPGGALQLLLSASGRSLLVRGPDGVSSWHLPAQAPGALAFQGGRQRALAFAPSGLLASADDLSFSLASPEPGSGFAHRGWQRVPRPSRERGAPVLAFSSQGLHAAVSGEGGARVFSLGPSGSLSFAARVPAEGGVALSADARQVFVAEEDAVRAFEVRTEKPLWEAKVPCAALLSSAGRSGLWCAAPAAVLELDPATGALRGPGCPIAAATSLAEAGPLLAAAAPAGAFLCGGGAPRLLPGTAGARQVALSSDGAWLATAGASGDLLLWDARGPALLARLPSCAGTPTSLSFSPEAAALAVVCEGRVALHALPEAKPGR